MIAAHLSNDDHGICHIAGVRARATCEGGELAVRLERPDGSAILPDQQLTMVTNDFMATGGDGLLDAIPGLIMRGRTETDETLRDVIANELAKRDKPLNPHDPQFFDPSAPRIVYPGKRPVRCQK